MTLIIVLMFVAAYLLIATGHFTGVNKAAIAMFLGCGMVVAYLASKSSPAIWALVVSARNNSKKSVDVFLIM